MPLINRKNFIAMATISILQLRLPFASAAAAPTLKPTRLGQTIIWRGKKYTAIRSGKKLIWNKGVAIPTKKPSPEPTAATLSPTPAPTSPIITEIDLAASEEVADRASQVFFSKNPDSLGKAFFISRDGATLVALDTICTHLGCRVSVGIPQLICGCHLSLFNRMTGAAEGGPAELPLRAYPVREVSGRIIVTNS